jgi:hypothetical protein
MKLIALRIDEEEKARLEQLAEAGDVTLSRALREGASLYLTGLHGRAHRMRGGRATFHGVRRDKKGRALNTRSSPTAGEREQLRSMRESLLDDALGSIQTAWDNGERPGVVLAAAGQWLSLVGEIYVSNPGEPGWDWFLHDYCEAYAEPAKSESLRTEIKAALLRGTDLNVGAVLEALDAGFRRFLDETESQEIVRRAVLPTWHVLETRLR